MQIRVPSRQNLFRIRNRVYHVFDTTRPDSLVPLHSLLKPKRNPTTLQGRVFRGRRNGDQRKIWRQKVRVLIISLAQISNIWAGLTFDLSFSVSPNTWIQNNWTAPMRLIASESWNLYGFIFIHFGVFLLILSMMCFIVSNRYASVVFAFFIALFEW